MVFGLRDLFDASSWKDGDFSSILIRSVQLFFFGLSVLRALVGSRGEESDGGYGCGCIFVLEAFILQLVVSPFSEVGIVLENNSYLVLLRLDSPASPQNARDLVQAQM